MNQIQQTGQNKSLKSIIASPEMQEQFKLALPKHISPERFGRIAITAITKTPKLQECTKESFMQCLLDLSAMGLEPDGRRAYLIPYCNHRANTTTCTLIVSYMGLVELVRRNGDVVKIHAEVVHKNDDFVFDMGEVTKHQYGFEEDRGEPVAAYAMVQFKDGSTQCEVMSKTDIEKIRQASQGKNQDPWTKHWGEMAKKTVFRRLTKWLTLSPEIRDAVDKLDDNDFRNVTPAQQSHVRQVAIDPIGDFQLPSQDQVDVEGEDA